MKKLEIEKKFSEYVAQYMAQGYVIKPNNSSFLGVEESVRMESGDKGVWLMLTVHHQPGDRYWDKAYVVSIMVNNYDKKVEWDGYSPDIEHAITLEDYYSMNNNKFWSNDSDEGWFTQDVERANAAKEKHSARCGDKKFTHKLAIKPTDSFAKSMRKYKGFGRSTSWNISITSTNYGYRVVNSNGREHIVLKPRDGRK